MSPARGLPLLVTLLLAGEARAQLLLDQAAAAGAADNVGAGAGGAVQRQAAAIRNGADAAVNGGPFGKGPGWVPGMPQPAQGQEAQPGGRGVGVAPAGGGGGGGGGLILYDQLKDVSPDGAGAEEGGPPEPVPEQYIVVKGDTLWSICARFFQNPWYWPKLWSYNEMITNPHWIYPGDLLSMYPPGQKPPRPAAALDKRLGTPRRITRSGVLPSGIFLRQNGFVEPGELDAAGKIVGSKEEKIMLASLDEVYVEVNPKKPLRVSERYTIYRVLKSVRRPYGNHETLGNVVEILGDVEVKQVTSGGIARAVIREALAPIERGYRVGPLRRTYKLVDPKVNQRALEGVVVETLLPTAMVGAEQMLFVDLGRADGLVVGNRLFVIRRGDGYTPIQGRAPDDQRYPKEVISEILIVDVRDKTAAGLITRPIKEVRVSDHVEARKGY